MKSLLWSLLGLAAAPMALAQQYSNPILWEDLADLDVFRVDDKYYYSASTMHYSPGAPILQSYDLVNWQFIGHSVPELSFGAKYYLNTSSRAYVNGIWASTMRYRKSNGMWYWYGCIDFARTYVFTSRDPTAKWSANPPINTCFYDAGLLIDDDDKMYIAYGQGTITVAELSSDGMRVVRTQVVMPNAGFTVEGARFYKINGKYYIWITRPANGQFVLRADSVFGTYTRRTVLDGMGSPIPASGTPHQGGIVDTPNGNWYYMAFLDAYPGGRIPVLAPLTWSDGWPSIVTVGGAWGKNYNMPVQTSKSVTPAGPHRDTFTGASLGHEWEWNHNPDNSAWSISNGLTLRTVTVTTDFYQARNTLTHRILGPKSSATWRINVANMADGDVAGAAIFRDESAYIGIRKNGANLEVVAMHGIIASESQSWRTTNPGTVRATASVNLASSSNDIWFRVVADVTANFGRTANNPVQFLYSTDGSNFRTLGPNFMLHNRWQYFMAFRFAVFNYATKARGGSIVVKEFDMQRA